MGIILRQGLHDLFLQRRRLRAINMFNTRNFLSKKGEFHTHVDAFPFTMLFLRTSVDSSLNRINTHSHFIHSSVNECLLSSRPCSEHKGTVITETTIFTPFFCLALLHILREIKNVNKSKWFQGSHSINGDSHSFFYLDYNSNNNKKIVMATFSIVFIYLSFSFFPLSSLVWICIIPSFSV